MQHDKCACPKCNQREFETGEIRVSGGFWSRIFDMQNKR
ncbi:zinc ribbon domain-containing protein [Shewanella sp. 1CM18E]|nr:zinc ribbon domain-containing protein [Shewanella sp. 1CM18E]MCK8044761.1 zinc ribbon domain-containing protein [Shewanella sp. 1CM18E]